MKNSIISIICSAFTTVCFAQDAKLYEWQVLQPNNNAYNIAFNGNEMFVASDVGVYSRNLVSKEHKVYTKANGLHDVQARHLVYDKHTNTVIVAYSNSNIDLIKDNNIRVIPYLKSLNTVSDKTIYNVIAHQGLGYVASGQGITIINLEKAEIKESIRLGSTNLNLIVKDILINNNIIYAATDQGVYKASLNTVLQVFNNWQKIKGDEEINQLAILNNKVYAAAKNKVLAIENDTLRAFYHSTRPILNLNEGSNKIYISEFDVASAKVSWFDNQEALIDSAMGSYPIQVQESIVGTPYVADGWRGVRRLNQNQFDEDFKLEGLLASTIFNMHAQDGELLIVYGGYNDKLEGYVRGEGITKYKDGQWVHYNTEEFKSDNRPNLSFVTKAPDGTILAASFKDGLYQVNTDGSKQVINDPSITGPCVVSGPNFKKAAGLAFDQNNTLWLTVNGAFNELMARDVNGQWHAHHLPYRRGSYIYQATNIVVDDNNLKWYISPYGGGVVVYDDNNTLGNVADDRHKLLTTGQGYGNLPSNFPNTIIKDKNNEIWIGTNNGIGIISCGSNIFDNNCETELRIVQYDEFAGRLFSEKNVRALAVDGANRKWVGTNDGVWLLSDDGGKIISRFTAENSPLPSNMINDIQVDPSTGFVYFATDYGIAVYRGDATEPSETNDNLLVFPNPVRKDYTGPISVKGLAEDVHVSITDINGRLIYKAKANGGTFVWNGKDYTGRKPATGVYLVFVTNPDGTQKKTGKFVFEE